MSDLATGLAPAPHDGGVIDRTVVGMGYELVDVERAAGGLLRVTIDHLGTPGERAITLDDCEAVTRQLQYALEVDAVDYARLEVSSPGLDRPLRSAAHFERFAGEPVLVTLKLPFSGRKRFAGVLRGLVSDADGSPADAAASAVGVALLLDDALLAAPGPAKPPPRGVRRKPAPPEQLMCVRFDEIREARLVPVVSFKGRREQAAKGSE